MGLLVKADLRTAINRYLALLSLAPPLSVSPNLFLPLQDKCYITARVFLLTAYLRGHKSGSWRSLGRTQQTQSPSQALEAGPRPDPLISLLGLSGCLTATLQQSYALPGTF